MQLNLFTSPDIRLGKFLSLEKLCCCTQTYQQYPAVDPFPKNPESIVALEELCDRILDPIIQAFGLENFRLTYGFCSSELKREMERIGRLNICPAIDQHCAMELNARNSGYICKHPGAAADIRIAGVKSDRVLTYAVTLPFDSLYYYGTARPLHISYGSSHRRTIWDMTMGKPRRVKFSTPTHELHHLPNLSSR